MRAHPPTARAEGPAPTHIGVMLPGGTVHRSAPAPMRHTESDRDTKRRAEQGEERTDPHTCPMQTPPSGLQDGEVDS